MLTTSNFSEFDFTPFPVKVKFLRQPIEKTQNPSAQKEPVAAGEKAPAAAPFILCRSCLHAITRPADRISVDGRHYHTFANPYGMVFEIGCFQSADGCAGIGSTSEEFTWFTGYHWQVCVCARCLIHLGWRFDSPGSRPFYALIMDRLIEPSPGW